MYKTLIENYIKNLNYETLDKYINKNYPFVTKEEKQIIYSYIKNNWQEIYDEDKSILLEIKEKVSNKTYEEITKLLNNAYKLKNR